MLQQALKTLCFQGLFQFIGNEICDTCSKYKLYQEHIADRTPCNG